MLEDPIEAAEALIARGKAGEADKALEALRELDDPPAGMIAAAEAIKAAPRSDPGYVRHLFDQFSADYDDRMIGQLGYAAPQILMNLAAMVMPDAGKLAILDLGCGTGLAGLAFKPLAAWLDGVDLSPAMIEKARARHIYDNLEVGDLETALGVSGPAYDLILAADTLVYLGDLSRTFEAAHARLHRDGFFLFTVEKAHQEGFEFGPKRRWRHSEAFLRALAARTGFRVAGLVAATPRHEAGEPVDGFAVALVR